MKARKLDALLRLKKYIDVTEVVDVGVREGTADLRLAFPAVHHYLIDPMNDDYSESIKSSYRGISFSMISSAVSDEEGWVWLVKTALDRDGRTTHSNLREKPEEVDGKIVTSCERVAVRRLDSLLDELGIKPGFLLKIDVDGIEEKVIDGASASIQMASAVVCECTYSSLHSRLGVLLDRGFSLVDLVDRVYYGDSLYQLDVIVVRKNLIQSSSYRPSIEHFNRSKWTPVE